MIVGTGSSYQATDGAAYEVFLGRWTRRLAEPLLDFAEFSPNGRLLDVGCGTGSLARAMAKRWPARPTVAIDIAPAYVEFAQSQTPIEGLRFEEADASKLPFAHDIYAGAAAQLVLNFVPDPIAALSEMVRVVVPGGRIVAAVWDFRGGLVYQRMFWDTASGIDPNAATARDKLFSGALALPDGLLRLFEACGGLGHIDRSSITIRMDYAKFEDYWRPMCGGQGPVGGYLERLEPDLRGRIEEEVRKAYLSGAVDGPRSMTASAWAVRATVSQ